MLPLFLFAVLWLGASLGHVAWTAHAINFMHSTRYRNWWIKLLRKACHAWQALGPFLFLCMYPELLWQPATAWLQLPWLVFTYLVCMWILGILYVPWVVLRRHARSRPALLLHKQTRICRVARELGHAPIGNLGLPSRLARLPGNQIFNVEFNQLSLAVPNLPASWQDLSILHVSDLHCCGVPELAFFEFLGDACRAQPVDLFLITGDFVDSDVHYHWLPSLLANVKCQYGAYAVLGNHDALYNVARVRHELRGLGITPIGGMWLEREIRGKNLILIGNEMPWIRPLPDLSDCPTEGFRLCLSHSPDQIGWARQHQIDLMLCGHTHGGQIRIPGIGPIFVPSRFGAKYDQGVFYEPPTVMCVSRGLSGTTPVRYFCRPEITWLTLKTVDVAKSSHAHDVVAAVDV